MPVAQTVKKIYNKLSQDERALLPNKAALRKMGSRVQLALRQKLPQMPKSLDELVIDKKYHNLTDENDGRFYDSSKHDEDRFIIWTTKTNLNLLKNAKRLALDATFRVPKGFRQLLILHVCVNGRFVPVLYCFMTTKTKRAYKLVFDWIKSQIVSITFT